MMNKLKYLPMATIGFSALAIMLAIILSGYNYEGGLVSVAFGTILLTVAVISKKLREVTVLFYLSASLLFSGIVMVATSNCSVDVADSVTGKNVPVVATVTGESEVYPSKSIYILETRTVNGKDVNVKLRLISNTSVGIYAGDEIAFTSKVYSVEGFEDSLKRYYLSEGIYLGANIYNGDDDITVLKDGEDTLIYKLQEVRDVIKKRIFSVLPNEYGAVGVAMLLGDKSSVSDETLNTFKGAGIYHLFAVSGLHLSIWVLGIFNFLNKLGVSKRFNSFLAILMILLFMSLTGFTPSVTRAGIMLIVLMTGNLFGRTAHSLNSLGLSLFIILAVNPMAAASVSLLLSFSATLGIVTLYRSIDKFLDFRLSKIKKKVIRKSVKAILSIFLVSVCASIFAMPVSSVVFGEVCLVAPLTNVFVSYSATLMMISAGGIALLFSIPFGVNLCGFICGIVSKYTIAVSDFFGNMPFSSIKADSIIFLVFLIVSISVVICCFITFKSNKTRFKAVCAGVVCVGIVCSCVKLVYNHNLTTVRIMDVDDGICIVASDGKEKIVIGSGSSDNYCIDDIVFEIYDKTPSLLIIPDNNEWNSSLALQLSERIGFERIVSGEHIDNVKSIVQPDFKLNPWNDASIEFHKNEKISYAYCVFGTSDLLIIFDSAEDVDFSSHPKADILICSYYLPTGMDLSAFDSVIVSSTEAVGEDMINLCSVENPNIYSTLGESDFTVKMRNNKAPLISYN